MLLIRRFKFYANVLFASVALLAIHVHAAPEENSAGTVTFALGQAFLNGDERVKVGSQVHQNDVITTLGTGHVHIRFVDDGLVSIRPNSTLSIEHYEFDRETPANSIIKFNLNQGVVRSISGQGAKSARDKFRLNTPIAAIGVRGTDFTVKASNELLQAVVNEGAIAVAALSSKCSAGSMGPCSGAVELDSSTKQLLELSTLYQTPKLIPLSADIPSELANQVDKPTLSSDANDAQKENDSDSNNAPDEDLTTGGNSPYNSSTFITNDMSDAEIRSAISNRLSESNIGTVEPGSIPKSGKLAWGRLSEFGKQVENKDSIVYADISLSAEGRDPFSAAYLVGEMNGLPAAAVLFRNKSTQNSINRSLAKVDFDLSSSQVNLYQNNGHTEGMTVLDSFLTVDFSSGLFETGLTLDSDVTSRVDFAANGSLSDSGELMLGSDSPFSGSFAGATTFEGDEAAYMFYKAVEEGLIEGVTIWHKQ